MSGAKRGLFLILLLCLAAPVARSESVRDDYDPSEAGHPLRIAAYLLHPVGVTLDYLIFRPAWRLGANEPWRTLFGRRAPLAELAAMPESVEPSPQPAP